MKNLTLSEIRSATRGAAYVCEKEDGIHFHRFTEEEEGYYRYRFAEFYRKALSTSGIKLTFRTDSRHLSLSVHADSMGSHRTYFSLDVLVNGKPIGYLDNYGKKPLSPRYHEDAFPLGDFAADFDLGEGEKTLTLHLPWSVILTLRALSLDDGASFAPVPRPDARFIAYGDSITQGYDATRPHLRQINRLADALDAEEHNKAIGGEVFCPGLAACTPALSPDFITVAYGTNDWGKTDFATFAQNCPAFYAALAARHPRARIFALTPIPRGGIMTNENFGHFYKVAETIRAVAAQHENITLIEGAELMPYDKSLYSDGYLHPNDAGFAVYADNLIRKIRTFLA